MTKKQSTVLLVVIGCIVLAFGIWGYFFFSQIYPSSQAFTFTIEDFERLIYAGRMTKEMKAIVRVYFEGADITETYRTIAQMTESQVNDLIEKTILSYNTTREEVEKLLAFDAIVREGEEYFIPKLVLIIETQSLSGFTPQDPIFNGYSFDELVTLYPQGLDVYNLRSSYRVVAWNLSYYEIGEPIPELKLR